MEAPRDETCLETVVRLFFGMVLVVTVLVIVL
jgi:hypothetical protein